MEAVIDNGGKQYKVKEGTVITVEKVGQEDGSEIVFDRVLVVNNDGEYKIGRPTVEGAKVIGKVLETGKAKKIIVFKFKPKKNYRRKQGHRQPFSKVLIEKIEA